MEQFEQKFKEDALDLIRTLEEDLLQLQAKPENTHYQEAIFRSLHTLKGAGAMFGYEKISELAHNAETIYGKIQENEISVTENIIKTTFNIIDFFKYLLDNKEIKDKNITEKYQTLLDIIAKLTNKEKITKGNKNTSENSEASTYYIKFCPKADFEERGINLFGVLEEVDELGENSKIEREATPEMLADGNFFMFWEIIIGTEKPQSEIEDIFIFFEEQYKVEKIADQNLFECNEFRKKLEHFVTTREDLDLEHLTTNESCAKKEVEEIKEVELQDITVEQQSDEVTFSKYKTTSIRVSASKLDELMNLVSEFITTKATIDLISEKYKIKELEDISEKFGQLAKRFQENALMIRLVPLRNMLIDIERLISSLSKKLGKEVSFVTQGTDTELDKNIIDNLSEPIMHIIRNSIDHGIETTEERIAKEKSPKGQIKLMAFHAGGNVFIQIHDDGKGLDLKRIRKKAETKGIINRGEKVSKTELANLIFQPGFTTSKQITKVSGRGMGMDIVKQRIQALRGEVEINTEKDLGTYITIKLPITLSILDTLHVYVGNRDFLIPSYLVVNVHTDNNLKILEKEKSVMEVNGEPVPIINLIKKYGDSEQKPEFLKIVVVKFKDKNYGLIVSEIVGDHQAVLKPLGEVFKEQEIISGASILGNGKIALILNTNKLIPKFS